MCLRERSYADTCIHLQNSREYLSAIPEGLAFPGKSWSHIRELEGACGLQQISSHFPACFVSNAPQPHTTYRLRGWYIARAMAGRSSAWDNGRRINKWQFDCLCCKFIAVKKTDPVKQKTFEEKGSQTLLAVAHAFEGATVYRWKDFQVFTRNC